MEGWELVANVAMVVKEVVHRRGKAIAGAITEDHTVGALASTEGNSKEALRGK